MYGMLPLQVSSTFINFDKKIGEWVKKFLRCLEAYINFYENI